MNNLARFIINTKGSKEPNHTRSVNITETHILYILGKGENLSGLVRQLIDGLAAENPLTAAEELKAIQLLKQKQEKKYV